MESPPSLTRAQISTYNYVRLLYLSIAEIGVRAGEIGGEMHPCTYMYMYNLHVPQCSPQENKLEV